MSICEEVREVLQNHICNTDIEIFNSLDAKKNILLEGAQGIMLDVDMGTNLTNEQITEARKFMKKVLGL